LTAISLVPAAGNATATAANATEARKVKVLKKCIGEKKNRVVKRRSELIDVSDGGKVQSNGLYRRANVRV
jgi:hypothetical protein